MNSFPFSFTKFAANSILLWRNEWPGAPLSQHNIRSKQAVPTEKCGKTRHAILSPLSSNPARLMLIMPFLSPRPPSNEWGREVRREEGRQRKGGESPPRNTFCVLRRPLHPEMMMKMRGGQESPFRRTYLSELRFKFRGAHLGVGDSSSTVCPSPSIMSKADCRRRFLPSPVQAMVHRFFFRGEVTI